MAKFDIKPAKTSPWGPVVLAVFWNGCVSVFVAVAIHTWVEGKGNLFMTLFMIPFVLIGVLMIYLAVQGFKPPRAETVIGSRSSPWLDEDDKEPSGPVTLKPQYSPLVKLLGCSCVALFWNGIVSVFVYKAVESWQTGSGDWFLTLFIIPFVLIGLLFVLGTFYYLLALANPRAVLIVSSESVPLGGKLNVEWKLSGATERISNLRVYLEGREEAKYTRGTSTYTDKSTFTVIELRNTKTASEIRRGQATANIPSSSMHSLDSLNNKIIWSLWVHGEISGWPDLKEEFPMKVRPIPLTQLRKDEDDFLKYERKQDIISSG